MKRSYGRRKFLTHCFLGIVGLCLIFPAGATAQKIGYIDVAKVFEGYQRTKDQDTQLQSTGKKKEEEREAIVHEIRRLKDEQALLAEEAREKKQEAIDAKVRELQDFDLVARRELTEERNKTVREIFKDVDEVVQRYGERKAYDFIFNERVLLYRSPRYDISRDILDELNREYAKKK